MKDFSARLERIWQLRHGREIEACEQELKVLERKFPESGELSIVRASLLRAEGKIAESNALLLSAGEGEFGGRKPFQRALNFFALGDYAAAWPLFQRANALLGNGYERFMAVGNLVLCRDNLGLNFDQELEDLERQAKQIPAFPDFTAQARTLRQRWHFRRGEIPASLAAGEELPSQGQYFRHWAASLPYVTEKISPLDPALLPKHFFAFRLNTLLGKDDEGEAKISELADRIYLWAWKWMAGDPSFPIEKVVRQVQRLRSNPTKPTCEDFLLLRNALGWIDLLGQTKVSERLLPNFSQLVSGEFALLATEWEWIQYFSRQLRGETPLPPHTKFYGASFEELTREDGKFAVLRERFRYLRYLGREEKNTIYPDLGIAISKEGKKTKSREAISLALLTLQEPTISFAVIARSLWGIRSYDPLIHAARIHRATLAMKKFFPLKCESREGILYVVWKIQPAVAKIPDGMPGHCQEWQRLHSGEQIAPALAAAGSTKMPITREEVERDLGCSRATAARWLKEKVDTGLLRKIGQGKNIRYEWRLN